LKCIPLGVDIILFFNNREPIFMGDNKCLYLHDIRVLLWVIGK
jgi:hypothetical protein